MQNKVVLITGSSSGFGKAMVPLFLEAGWRVIASMRSVEQRAGMFASEMARFADRLELIELDVKDASHRARLVGRVHERYQGRLDCLINNAGYGLFGSLEDMTESQLREQFEVNFFGLALLTRELLPSLRKAKGRVINVSSVWGRVAFPLTGAYNASKFAVEGLSEALRHELKPHGVQVAIVEPGAFGTSFSRSSVWAKPVAQSPYLEATAAWFAERQGNVETGPKPGQAARKIVALAEKSRMPLRTGVGMEALLMLVVRYLPQRLSLALLDKVFQGIFYKKPAMVAGEQPTKSQNLRNQS